MRQRFKSIIVQALIATLTGCSYQSSGLVSTFTEEAIKSVDPGTSTRDDVLRRFGTPHFTVETEDDVPGLPGNPHPGWTTKPRETILFGRHRNEQDRIYGYKWYTKEAFVVVQAITKSGFTENNYLCIEFTPENRVKRFKHIKGPVFSYGGDADKELRELLLVWVREK